MPVFDFRCGSCDNTYEAVLLKSDSKPTCPKCHSDEAQKKIFLSFGGIAIIPQDHHPKNDRDLKHYLGNGRYMKGYKR